MMTSQTRKTQIKTTFQVYLSISDGRKFKSHRNEVTCITTGLLLARSLAVDASMMLVLDACERKVISKYEKKSDNISSTTKN